MKKRLLAAVLSFTLAIAPISGVKAQGISSAQKNMTASISGAVVDVRTMSAITEAPTQEEPGKELKVGIYDKDGSNVSAATPYALTKKSQIDNPKVNSYEVMVPAGYSKDALIPVKVKSRGALFLGVLNGFGSEVSISRIYKEAACVNYTYVSQNVAYIPSAGTYYIKIDKYNFSGGAEHSFLAQFAFVSGANTELKNKTNVINATFGQKSPLFYKMSVKKTTKIVVSINLEYSGYATLCNAKKAALTSEEYVYSKGDKLVYVVPKGTYYLKIKSMQGFVSTTATYVAVSNSAGASKAKAGTLKVNGQTKNILICPKDSASRAYYLKFNNPKRQTIKLNVKSSYTSGKVQLEFYDAKGTKFGSKCTIYNGVGRKNVYTPYSYTYGSSAKKLPKGTYYIKVKKIDKRTSGIIEVNVKNK